MRATSRASSAKRSSTPSAEFELGDEGIERAIGVVGGALVPQPRVRLGRDALAESRRNARLADPRLARDQHDLPFALPGEALALDQETDLVFAADEIGQTRRVEVATTTVPGSAKP